MHYTVMTKKRIRKHGGLVIFCFEVLIAANEGQKAHVRITSFVNLEAPEGPKEGPRGSRGSKRGDPKSRIPKSDFLRNHLKAPEDPRGATGRPPRSHPKARGEPPGGARQPQEGHQSTLRRPPETHRRAPKDPPRDAGKANRAPKHRQTSPRGPAGQAPSK